MSQPQTRTFFHCHSAQADPRELLDPGRQYTEPWGSPEHGRCDKCGGEGMAPFECRSCLETGPQPDCPACEGRVRFRGTCPTCEGSGEIHRTRRRGIAVFPSREGLYRYLAERGAEVRDRVVVELEGRLSEDADLDADCGALLVYPQAISATEPLDPALIRSLQARPDVQLEVDPGNEAP